MALDRIAFLLVDSAGVPKTNAAPTFAIYRDRGLVDRSPPTGALATQVPHLGGGIYGCTASADDVLAGTAYMINAGANAFNAGGGTRLFGSVSQENNPFFVQLFEDGAGALWAGASPTLGFWNDFAGGVVAPKPTLTAIAGAYLWGFTPPFAELLAGRVFRWDAPALAFPQYPHGVAFYGSGSVPVTVIETIRTELAAAPGVTDLVGTRMYPNLMPQGVALPAIVYSVISDTPENTFTGTSADRLNSTRVQIDCYAVKYLDAHAVAEAVDLVVSNLSRHDLTGAREGKRDLYDDESQLHRVSLDFVIMR